MTDRDLPPVFEDWFARRGWQPHAHQRALLAETGDALLIAPTGGGKTLAGFLPSLVDLWLKGSPEGLHTVYVSPLRALTADIARSLGGPVADLGMALRIEDRTGDTGAARRSRQRVDPPHILLTTPESLALLLSYPEAPKIFGSLLRLVIDEVHALAESKRGDQLMLGVARLRSLAPGLQVAALSATVADPGALAADLLGGARVILADPGPLPDIAMLPTARPAPWAGGGGRHAAPEVMAAIVGARLTLVFLNTRAQAELFFQALWEVNAENLPIGIHHGSLSREARQKAETAMAEGRLRAVVCTGSLDLGLDWGDVDLVIQVGAPRNILRLVQRIGRANHRLDAPSRARIVPANRFEVVECAAAIEAVMAGDLDGEPRAQAPLDVLCQHILLTACAGPFRAEALYAEVRGTGPFAALPRADFDACLAFCATGGYALRAYDRWQRLVERDGAWQLRDPRSARDLRMNIGTIVGTEAMAVRMRRGRGGQPLGEVEEAFAATLLPGDSFLIGGQAVRFEAIRDMAVEVSPSPGRHPRIAVYSGQKLATSLRLSRRVEALISDPARWQVLPPEARDWLAQQARLSALPSPGVLVCESFGRGGEWYFCLHGFAGRNAHQTLGLLLTRRMETAGLGPLGFVAGDHALLVRSVDPVADAARLLDPQGLRDGLGDWLAGNAVMKRSFRSVATVAGLIQRNLPGGRKSGRQATFSSDILYDTLRRHDPGHLLLRLTAEEAQRGLVDFGRIEAMLAGAGEIRHLCAPHVTPLAAPLLLEAGWVSIRGQGEERQMRAEAEKLLSEAGLA